jgi:hypothetical protein
MSSARWAGMQASGPVPKRGELGREGYHPRSKREPTGAPTEPQGPSII